ncbi:MAG: MFS transporter [Rhodospirillaceae bacterium]|nr:MFS transporter [Rhodospirillaceae bacterium]|tara:strand:- start:13596 stop:14942 length:1347 start_codon:yes stop_codon:yes gene_type:complete
MPDSPESAGSEKPGMKKNVALLAMCQALFNSSTGVVLSVSALVGLALASNKSLATLPQALQWEATAAFAIPLAMMMRRFGRRTGFIFGALMGSVGALVAAIAIFQGSFELYLVAIIFFGAFTISGQTYRFAAADVADDKWRSVAISLVVGGGVLAAFVGPEISKWTHDVAGPWLGNETFAKAIELICGPGIAAAATTVPGQEPPYQFASTFIVLAFIPIILIFVVSLVGFPQQSEQKFENSGRPMGEIVRQPGYIVAVLCAVIGWGVMVLMMAATPLAMVKEFGHTFEDSAFIAQWHMFGMFAPSFFTGSLIRRYGVLNVLLAGLVLSSSAALIGFSGGTIEHFWFANVCVGCGWNFLFVGGTHLLTQMYRPEEKAKAQGMNDFLVFQSVAAFSFSAGLLQNTVGWTTVCALLLPCVGIVFIAVLYLKFMPGAAPPGEGTDPKPAAAE